MSNAHARRTNSEVRSKTNTRGSSRGRETSKDRTEKNYVSRSDATATGSRKEPKTVTVNSTGTRPSHRDTETRKVKPERSKETSRPSKTTAGVYGAQKSTKSHEKTRSSVASDAISKKSSLSGSTVNHDTSELVVRHSRSSQKSSKAKTPAITMESSSRRPLLKQNTVTLDTNDKIPDTAEEEVDSYEDDFEEYESDFEKSSEEEKSNGNSDNEEDRHQQIEIAHFEKPRLPPTTFPAFLVDENSDSAVAKEIAPKPKSVNSHLNINSDSLKTKEHNAKEVTMNTSTNQQSRMASAAPSNIQNQVSHSHIDFSNAKQLQSAKKATAKAKERGQQLLELITLDSVSFNLFSKTPAAYAEYMETFGNINAKQACVQTGEDSVQEETQTDAVEKLDLWTQYPPHTSGAIGGQYISQLKKISNIHGVKDWKRLNKFVKDSGRVICTLLEEEGNISDDETLVEKSRDMPKFSERVSVLKLPQFARDRAVSFVSYSKYQANIILSIYKMPAARGESETLKNKGIICVWNIFQPTRPQEVLVCSSQPVCCCFGGNSEFVFAGMVDGSVATWDLRESSCSHLSENDNGSEWVMRSPTYSTAEVMSDSGHHSPVVAILCNQNDRRKSDENTHKGVTQVATLEEQACIHIWVLTFVTRTESGAVSSSDLGLRPGGCIKLLKSATIDLQTIPTLRNYMENNGRVLDFVCNSQDDNTFYVSTDASIIIRCTVNNMKPKVYLESQDISLEVSSLSFSPFKDFNYFLTGSCEGNIKLFSIAKEKPIMAWTCKSQSPGIRKVLWSNSSPNIFYTLDNGGQIHLWDLSENNYTPVISTTISTKTINCCDMSSDTRYESNSTNKLHPNLAVGFDNGVIEVYFLVDKYSRNSPEDRQAFNEFANML